MKRIAVIGATGTLARPVVEVLKAAGYSVTEISRKGPVQADVLDIASLRRALMGAEVVYLSLSLSPTERPSDPHAESDGVRNVIEVSRELGVKRIAMLSSLVKNYQGMNGFHWWAFDVKQRGVDMLKASGIPSTIFYPSSFMENFGNQRRGNKLEMAGKSKQPMWFIAGSDYGRQVAKALSYDDDVSREYVMQGPEPFTYDAAARVYVENYPHDKLEISTAPLWLLKTMGMFSGKMRYISRIIDALDNYPEKFEAEGTWAELGKPTVTLAEFAKKAES
jgi:uncharacterized protein YbjT (DUF2867 family)